jgi:hypothetical protein
MISVGCSQTEKNYVARVKLQKLTEADMYNNQLVYDVIFDSEELPSDSVKNASHQLFLKGIDLYKNKKNPVEAIEYFKRSIVSFPDAKAYYELGNALTDTKLGDIALKEALDAYDVASYLDFKPASILYFKKACAENLKTDKNKGWQVVSYLRAAFREGFSDTNLIKTDERIKSIVKTDEYKEMLTDLAANKSISPETLFDTYIKSFQVAEQPFEIPMNKVAMSDYSKQSISYDFAKFIPEMQNSEFGRGVSHDYFFVAKIAETPAYTAIIYTSVGFYGGDMQPVDTKLVTYTPDGTIISSKLFACQFSAEKVKQGRIENNEITLEDYKRIWKYPIDKVSFENNTIDKYELIAKAVYVLDDSGKILERSVPANYTDSALMVKQ